MTQRLRISSTADWSMCTPLFPSQDLSRASLSACDTFQCKIWMIVIHQLQNAPHRLWCASRLASCFMGLNLTWWVHDTLWLQILLSTCEDIVESSGSTFSCWSRTQRTQHGRQDLKVRGGLQTAGEELTIWKRSGRLKSSCTVEHCQRLPIASLTLMSILGPVQKVEWRNHSAFIYSHMWSSVFWIFWAFQSPHDVLRQCTCFEAKAWSHNGMSHYTMWARMLCPTWWCSGFLVHTCESHYLGKWAAWGQHQCISAMCGWFMEICILDSCSQQEGLKDYWWSLRVANNTVTSVTAFF